MKHKTLCFVTRVPEATHAQRIIRGALAQCEKYDYNLAVFASMLHSDFHIKDTITGDSNIYNLINYSAFDGIIIDTLTLSQDMSGESLNRIVKRLESGRHAPVVTVGMPFGGYTCIESANEVMLREMCRHVVIEHGKRKICILTGQSGNDIAEKRLEIFLDELNKYDIVVPPEWIVYGDFWYISGNKLAEDIISGKIPRPEAVICASDHMGLGLIETLTANGIRVPEDIIVIGFEGTDEAAIADISLSSFESNYSKAAADAVDYIVSRIEPERKIEPYVPDMRKMLHLGKSCGCQPDFVQSAEAFKSALYFAKKNYDESMLVDGADIGLLMERYILETFTGSRTPEECLENIWNNTYLIMPYQDFYICLREDWLDTESGREPGYPDKMQLALAASSVNGPSFNRKEDSIVFDTKKMIPRMWEDLPASVYYFMPVHFNEKTIGYAVLRRSVTDAHLPNLVLRSWLRFVNNALEMVRSRHRYVQNSVHDELTGLLNRRGMYELTEKLLKAASEDDSMFVAEIDMDGLKYINDNYGHSEGDYGLKTISQAIKKITADNEISVRAGGDEFYIIGVGRYEAEDVVKRIKEFEKTLAQLDSKSKKPFAVSASMGGIVRKVKDNANLAGMMHEADERMYVKKAERKKEKKN